MAAEGLKLRVLGWRVLRTFLVGERKDSKRGRSSASEHPLIQFLLLVSSLFLSLEGRKPRRAEGWKEEWAHELSRSRGRAGVSGVSSLNSGFLP